MTDLIHARHKVTGRIQEITRDQFNVFSDVLEEITPEAAEQARIDALLNPPIEGEESPVADLEEVKAYPDGDPSGDWTHAQIDAWAADQRPVISFEKNTPKDEKLASIATVFSGKNEETE